MTGLTCLEEMETKLTKTTDLTYLEAIKATLQEAMATERTRNLRNWTTLTYLEMALPGAKLVWTKHLEEIDLAPVEVKNPTSELHLNQPALARTLVAAVAFSRIHMDLMHKIIAKHKKPKSQ
jgi:hypothetical protein